MRVRFGCLPVLLLVLALSAAAGETGLQIPRSMLKESLSRLAAAKITVLAIEDAKDQSQVIICIDTQDSKRARVVIANGLIVDRIRDAE